MSKRLKYNVPDKTARITISGDTLTGIREMGGEYLRLPGTGKCCYGLEVVGDGYTPRMQDEEVLLVCTKTLPGPEDSVVVRFDGGNIGLFKLVYSSGGKTVFELLQRPGRHIVVDEDTIEFMHCILGIISPRLRAAME